MSTDFAHAATPIVVVGATGRIGGAVTRCLLNEAMKVRALTRDPILGHAVGLQKLGAELHVGDLRDFSTVEPAMRGVHTVVCSLQAFDERGRHDAEQELAHGRAVADAAFNAGVTTIIYVSCGSGELTKVSYLDTKREIAKYMKDRGLAVIELLPGLLMEWLDDATLSPRLTTYGMMPKVVGDKPLGWIAARDVGVAAAFAALNPATFTGRKIVLCSETATIRQATALYKESEGRIPFGFPLPRVAFRALSGDALLQWWEWLAKQAPSDPQPLRQMVKEPLSFRGYLRMRSRLSQP